MKKEPISYHDSVLVRYGEIGLKSPGVRQHLETLLRNHVGFMLNQRQIRFDKILRERGRLFVLTPDPEEAAVAASQVFGVVSTSPVWTIQSELEAISAALKQLGPHIMKSGQTFAIRARRTKTHPFTSQDVAGLAGKSILEYAKANEMNVKVNLDQPDVEIHIEVRQKKTYIFTKIIPGPSGLPFGSQGSIIGLHSGGIDSPVAEWLMMKRGCRVIPLYFDSELPSQNQLRNRAINAAKILADWMPEKKPELLIIPYRSILKTLSQTKFPKLTCVLCKRMMYHIATAVASQEKAQALVTGETLGQVASQTLSNITILNQATELPIFRPLISADKTETMDLARRIGTYETTSQDVGECFAVPKQPAIQALLKDVKNAESTLNIETLTKKALRDQERISLRET